MGQKIDMIFSRLTFAALSATVVLAQDDDSYYDSYYSDDSYSLSEYGDSYGGLMADDGGFDMDARAGFKKGKKKKKPRTTTPAPTTTEEPTTTTFPTTTTAQTTTSTTTTTTTTTTVAPAGKGKNNFGSSNKKPA